MPKPSDPPRAEGSFVDRQRLTQLEAVIERAQKTIAQQRDDIDELRARVTVSAARIEELLARDDGVARADAIEQRVTELEARPPATEARPPRDDEDAKDLRDRVERVDERLRVLEEGTGEARIRMRLERAGHRIDELDHRLAAVEEAQRSAAAAVERIESASATREERLSRIESLFDELAEELRQERDAIDLDGVRARLDDLETLVLRAGTDEEALRKKLVQQELALATLKESMVPAAPPGDDLTRIKGIGPKYARMLADLGVTTFAQIAAWTDEDVERAAEQLGIPAGRIKNAGWVEAAAKRIG